MDRRYFSAREAAEQTSTCANIRISSSRTMGKRTAGPLGLDSGETKEEMNAMLAKDEILAALAAVPGPDGKTPLPQSGAIDGVTVRDGKVFVAIKIDPAHAKAMEAMRADAEAKIKALPGVASALVTLTAESEGPAAAPGRPGRASAPPHRRAADPRHRQDHRRRLRQGRRRQVDDRLQSRARPGAARPQGRRARRRRVRPLDAAAVRHRASGPISRPTARSSSRWRSTASR